MDNQHIGGAVRALRERRGASQEAVAEAMRKAGHEKWSQATVWSVEQGTRPLRLAEAADLAATLEVSIDDLLRVPDDVERRARLYDAITDVARSFNNSRAELRSLMAHRYRLTRMLEDPEMRAAAEEPRFVKSLQETSELTPESVLEQAKQRHEEALAVGRGSDGLR